MKLTEEQEREGYWVEESGSNVLVWHHKNQVALLAPSLDIERKVQQVLEGRRESLKDIEEKTGWKPVP